VRNEPGSTGYRIDTSINGVCRESFLRAQPHGSLGSRENDGGEWKSPQSSESGCTTLFSLGRGAYRLEHVGHRDLVAAVDSAVRITSGVYRWGLLTELKWPCFILPNGPFLLRR